MAATDEQESNLRDMSRRATKQKRLNSKRKSEQKSGYCEFRPKPPPQRDREKRSAARYPVRLGRKETQGKSDAQDFCAFA